MATAIFVYKLRQNDGAVATGSHAPPFHFSGRLIVRRRSVDVARMYVYFAAFAGTPLYGTVCSMPAFTYITLHTTRLLLRPLKPSDAQVVFSMFTDTKFMEFVTSPPFKNLSVNKG